MGANGASERGLVDAAVNGLGLRVLSALILAPLVVGAVYGGTPYFEALMALAAVTMAFEWDRLCRSPFAGSGRLAVAGFVLAALMVAVAILARVASPQAGLAGLAAAAVAVWLAARLGDGRRPTWRAAGALYIGIPILALIALRDLPAHGGETVFWVLATVWATDSCAYGAGRLIGGPKFAPAISPHKTWAGMIGGLMGALACGRAAAYLVGLDDWGWLVVASCFLGIAAEAGDLAESAIKRRFGVKDSGHLIPGHGGILDRVDSLIVAAPVAAAMVFLSGVGPFELK